MNWKGGSLTPFTHSFSSFRAVILGHVISILDLDCSHEMMEVSRKWMSVFLISRTCEHIELCYILFHLHFQLHFGTLIHTQTLFVAGLFFISYFFLLPLIFLGFFMKKLRARTICEQSFYPQRTSQIAFDDKENCFRACGLNKFIMYHTLWIGKQNKMRRWRRH